MDIADRIKSITVKPAETWPVIEQEVTDLKTLYVPYMLILAAIPAVASFVGLSLIGVGGYGFTMRVPFLSGIGIMITQYIMTLVMIGVWGWLINMLANTFGGQPNLMQAIKLTVYASTPGMLAGIFGIVPSLGILGLVGGLYSLYVLYLGLPVMMKNPKEKTIPYMVVAAVVGIVCSVLISVLAVHFYTLTDAAYARVRAARATSTSARPRVTSRSRPGQAHLSTRQAPRATAA
jgi:hypothetical protein